MHFYLFDFQTIAHFSFIRTKVNLIEYDRASEHDSSDCFPCETYFGYSFNRLVACTKDNGLNTRELQAGTKCTIYAGVFAPGDYQPAEPVTVTGVYRGASSGLIYYKVTDANGVEWDIPDSDLQVMK